jgi:four helix bundle protein
LEFQQVVGKNLKFPPFPKGDLKRSECLRLFLELASDFRFWIQERVLDKDELKRRTKLFALRVMKLVGALPNSIEGRSIGNQLMHSGTSVGANYRAACRARSKAEFISKLGIALEEADESAFWMELTIESELLKRNLVEPLLQEANEFTAIMAASRKSASSRQKS